MIAYLDTSVVLRIALGEPGALAEWKLITLGVSSALLRVEGQCSLWRLHLAERLTAQEYARINHDLSRITETLDMLKINESVLARASQPGPFGLRTLDAIHLATATLYRDAQPANQSPIVFATHDRELAKAAHAARFSVIGSA